MPAESLWKKLRYPVLLLCILIAGSYLRLHMLGSQILLDDEWHGLNQVIGESVPGVLTGFNTSDNTSLPLNLYNLLLYRYAGWSETAIRLPVIIAGLLSLVLLPLLLRSVFNDRVSLVFALLLAVAPYPVFYSRFARAYSIVMLLCFLCLQFSLRWFATGERRYGAGFLLTGTLAAYTHPAALVVIIVPFLVVLMERVGLRIGAAPGKGAESLAADGDIRSAAMLQAFLLMPLFWIVATGVGDLPWGEGRFSAGGALTALTLLSGTVSVPLNVLFYLLCAGGCVLLFRRGGPCGPVFLLTVAGYLGALLVARPKGLETGVVFLRYMIVVVPIALTAVAVGVDGLLSAAERTWRVPVRLGLVPPVLLAIALYLAGPLPGVYASPNNFTNHSAYQGEYAPPGVDRSDARHVYPAWSISREEVPAFYHRLRDDTDVSVIIEYPMDICNYNNLFYYYQMVHGKTVLAGYSTDRSSLDYTADVPSDQARLPLRIGMLCADQILYRADEPGKLRFRTMVDVSRPDALRESGADLIVVHRDLMALRIMGDSTATIRVRYGWTPVLAGMLGGTFGPPVYSDSSIVCYSLRKGSS